MIGRIWCFIGSVCAVACVFGARAAQANSLDEWPFKVVPEPVAPLAPEVAVEDSPAAAIAVKPRQRFDEHPFGFQIRFGIGTSVGLGGVAIEYDASDWLNLGAGLGTNDLGTIGGGHIRFRPAIMTSKYGGALHAFVTEFAYSRGLYAGGLYGLFSEMCEGSDQRPTDPCYSPRLIPEAVSWGQVEFGWEFRGSDGLTFRATTGVAQLLSKPTWKCEIGLTQVPCSSSQPASWFTSTTFAIGYAF